MEKITQIANNPEKMRSMTGFGDGAPGGDLTKDLFMLLAILELQSSAYIDADFHFSKPSSGNGSKPPRDRLLSYLSLIGQFKKGGQTGRRGSSTMIGSAASQRTSSSSRKSEKMTMPPLIDIRKLKRVDLSNAEEFFKLKGAVLDEHLLRLILKSFTNKQETKIQEERLQSESVKSLKQLTIDEIVEAEIAGLQKQLTKEKEKVVTAQDDLTMAIDCAINSDEQAQILTLRTEINELKSKLVEVTNQLEESKEQKVIQPSIMLTETVTEVAEEDNANIIEQTNKLFELETKVAESVTEKAKTDERIERLQSINMSMQQMFDTNLEKAKIESDGQMQQMKI